MQLSKTFKNISNLNFKKLPNFENHKYGDITVCNVYLSKILIEHSEEFQSLLSDLIDAGSKKVVVDLSLCNFLSYSSWCVLVKCLKDLMNYNGRIVVVCNLKLLGPVISHTGVGKIFTFYSEINEAIHSFVNEK